MSSPILLDCDGVLCNFVDSVLEYVNAVTVTKTFRPADITDFDILRALECSHLQPQLDKHLIEIDACAHYKPYPGAQDFIETMRSRGYVFAIATAPYSAIPNWCHARERWLKTHFGIPKDKIFFASDKSGIRNSGVLVDDLPSNLHSYRAGGILFSQPWNRKARGVFRAETYAEVIDRFDWLAGGPCGT